MCGAKILRTKSDIKYKINFKINNCRSTLSCFVLFLSRMVSQLTTKSTLHSIQVGLLCLFDIVERVHYIPKYPEHW